MQNSLKTHTLTIGYIYVASLEGFSTVINTLLWTNWQEKNLSSLLNYILYYVFIKTVMLHVIYHFNNEIFAINDCDIRIKLFFFSL